MELFTCGFTKSHIQRCVEEDTPFGVFPREEYLSRSLDKIGKNYFKD